MLYLSNAQNVYIRHAFLAARGPNPAHRPYLFGPLSAPKYIEIHRAVVIIWPSDIYL